MSIIYNALQKIQQNRENDSATSNQEMMSRDDWIDVGIALIIAILLAVLMIAHYPQFNKNTLIKPTAIAFSLPNSVPLTKPIPKVRVALDVAEYKNQHRLNGVFISEEEKMAMINNHFFNLGDIVDGLKIVNIEFDRIKLKNEQGSLELRITI